MHWGQSWSFSKVFFLHSVAFIQTAPTTFNERIQIDNDLNVFFCCTIKYDTDNGKKWLTHYLNIFSYIFFNKDFR